VLVLGISRGDGLDFPFSKLSKAKKVSGTRLFMNRGPRVLGNSIGAMSNFLNIRKQEKLDSQYLDHFVNVEKSSTVETGMGRRLRLVYVEY
jgi:hypothetical protein